jgi:hypothetical protein
MSSPELQHSFCFVVDKELLLGFIRPAYTGMNANQKLKSYSVAPLAAVTLL